MEVSAVGGQTHGKKWTEEDDNFIRGNFGKLSYKEMAEKLNSTYHAVQFRATKRLGLRNYRSKKWTEAEKQFLRDNYPDKLGHYCAEKLGRSFHATHKMVEKLGIKPNWKYRYIADGYVILCHDRENKIAEHRYVMEQKLGRKLTSEDIVHHIDGNKQNNDPSNLFLTNRSEHAAIHARERGSLIHKI